MSVGKAEKKTTLDVDFFDWNRYNLTHTTDLSQWVASFEQEVNNHFKVDKDNNCLLITTVVGEDVPVLPGDVILRDVNGNYFRMDATTFAKSYDITIENGEEVTPLPKE